MSNAISSVAFSRDNQSAYISSYSGHIKMIKWQVGANSEDEFDFTEESKQAGGFIQSICLTKDEKYLLVGLSPHLRILETETREVRKKFKLTGLVVTISLIQDGKKAIITQTNGNFSILDLETLKKSNAKNITYDNRLSNIIVI